MQRLWLVACLAVLCLVPAVAQETAFNLSTAAPVARGAVQNLSAISHDFAPALMRMEAPDPDGDSYASYLLRVKEAQAQRYPVKEGAGPGLRSSASRPLNVGGFNATRGTQGIPLDTHLAISDEGQVVTVINFDLAVWDTTGRAIQGASLAAFFAPLSPQGVIFDPKVHYDPQARRWVVCALSFTATVSQVHMAFSQSSDAAGMWNLYTLDGNPNLSNSFFDYPMLSFSPYELFLTGNSVRLNEPWQTGFVETLVYQINKRKGYRGETLDLRVWSGIRHNGVNLRNLCPVKGAAENFGPGHYFLSNRNFDPLNTRVFMVWIKDTINARGNNLLVYAMDSDVPYGVPPNARQAGGGGLQTNDARVLDAFIFDDRIQFVGNSIDTATGRAAIYHGRIAGVSGARNLSGRLISHDTLDLGYPGIAFTGNADPVWGEQDAVIFFDYSAPAVFAGVGAVYVDNNGEYSTVLRIRNGQNYIDVLNRMDERWGDYTGCQRRYNQPGRVWVCGTYGLLARNAGLWVAELSRSTPVAKLETVLPETQVSVSPNPARDHVIVDFSHPPGQQLDIRLLDRQGRVVQSFIAHTPVWSGRLRFSFSSAPLPAGLYLLDVRANGKRLAVKKVMVE